MKKGNSLATTIKRMITPVEERRIETVDYYLYDLTLPHCDEAVAYRTCFGGVQFRCTHQATD